jgi:hypothetical protein
MKNKMPKAMSKLFIDGYRLMEVELFHKSKVEYKNLSTVTIS